MNLKHIKAVAFDLDGTLVDSIPDLAAAANAMRQHLGLPSWLTCAFRSMLATALPAWCTAPSPTNATDRPMPPSGSRASTFCALLSRPPDGQHHGISGRA
jgi:beta-phosphoglucomutase-like phosphatase (HAD superfamily)